MATKASGSSSKISFQITRLQELTTVVLEGLSGEEAVIVISNDIEKRSIHVGSCFGRAGAMRLNVSASCGEELRSWPYPWAIISQGTGTSLGGTLYLNFPCFYRHLPDMGAWPAQFFEALPENALGMKQLAMAISGHGEFDARDIEYFPLALHKIAWHAAACAAIIDGRKIKSWQIALDKIDEQARYALEWYRWAADAIAARQFDVLYPEPPDARCLRASVWIDALENLKEEFELLRGLYVNPGPFIAEWATRLEESQNSAYETAIGKLEHGHALTGAWKLPYGKKPSGWEIRAWNAGKRLEDEPGPIGWLARLLLALLLKLTKRDHLMHIVDLDSLPECLGVITSRIRASNMSADEALDLLKNLGASGEER